jgi:RimJ/RimL family protein N-acetyltransferase
MRTVHFTAGDINKMNVQSAQSWGAENITLEAQQEIAKSPHAYTAFDGDEVIACFGIAEYWPGRGLGWTYLSKNIGRRLVYVTKVCRRIFKECGIKRIEAAVNCDFEQGHRWMKSLGMTLEAVRMKAFSPDGKDCALYARVT